MRRPSHLSFLAPFLLALPVGAQAPDRSRPTDLDQELRAWRSQHGHSWALRRAENGFARMLFGGNRRGSFRPRDRADYVRAARAFATEARPLMGVADETLFDEDVQFLAMGTVGGADRVSVRMRQTVAGIPVRGGAVNALLTLEGDLLSLSSTALPALEGFDTRPTVGAARAAQVASADFREQIGVAPTRIGAAVLVIVKEKLGKSVGGSLAWEMELRLETSPGLPEVYLYRVAARDEARVIERENRVHDLDVGGTVRSFATPGLDPDSASNPTLQLPVPHATVTSSAGTVTTDADGNFNFPGVDGSLNVTVSFSGPFVDVVDDPTGSTHSLSTTISGTGNELLLNLGSSAGITAQANTFLAQNVMRDFIRRVNPADDTADFPVRANVNIDDTCNAFFDGVSTNYFRSGDGCVNSGYSTVVAHEMGHFLNQLYGSGNGGDGFGEGAADVWAMYAYDTPVVGAGFTTSGGIIRTGLNTRPYCGDGNPACYEEVHVDGEPLMGALWKVRRNLNASLGNALGDALADALFHGWMSAFDQATIDSIIEIQWLILDDDDGLIENGTPHYPEIDAAFREQGFPGFDLPSALFTNVTQIQDGVDDIGPYGVMATIQPLDAADIERATIHIRSGLASSSLPLTRVAGTDDWIVQIPAFPSPAVVEYSFEATTTDSEVQVFPSGAPLRFRIGREVRRLFDDFEGGDNGWTHRLSATQDDWHHDAPAGRSGSSFGVSWNDPANAFSGSRIWGNDLGNGNFNGAYASNVSNRLESSLIDLGNAVGTGLKLMRWLTVEEGIFDQAQILVNGSVVWQNPTTEHLIDTQWTPMTVDISAVADGVANTVIEFRLVSDGGLELGGWNIDDFEITNLTTGATTCMPTSYGGGLPGTAGMPSLDTAGQPAAIGNSDFELRVRNARPEANGAVLFGTRRIALAYAGGLLLALPEKLFGFSTDLFGQAAVALPIPDVVELVGLDFFAQALIVDGAAAGGFAMTQGLALSPCEL